MTEAYPRRAITEAEHLMLVRASDRDHQVTTTYGGDTVWLLGIESNAWAFRVLGSNPA